jgi:outer membrane protein assembly factor BamB
MDAANSRFAAALVGGLLLASTAPAADVGWRSDGTGAYPNATPPTDWSEPNVLWKTKLPGPSFGSPVLAGDRVLVVSDPAELLCVSAADGRVLWQRSHSLADLFDAATAEKVTAEFVRLHGERDRLRREQGKAKDDPERKAALEKQIRGVEAEFRELTAKYPVPPAVDRQAAGNSAATPACDGTHVYALFGNGIACAYTMAGEKLWVKFVEPSPLGFGHGSSPLLVDGKVLVHLKDLVALDARTGEEVWRTALPPQYASPIAAQVGTTAVVVSPGGAVVRVADGKVLLRNGDLQSSECTHLVDGGTLYTFGGTARAVRLVPAGDDAVKLERLWECRLRGGRRTPSAVLHDGLLYAVNTDGFLDVVDAHTGQAVYQQRLNVGEVYASATAAGEHLFFGGTKGEVVVVKPGMEYEEVAHTRAEGFGSCPVFSGRRLYLRTRQHLYCIGK